MLRRKEARAGAQASRFSFLGCESGTQIVELAATLPLLVVLVVGIFDFGTAFNLKQKLSNTAREAARFGSSQPTNDLPLGGGGAPASVVAVRDLVASSLTAAKVNDCGLTTAAAPSSNAAAPRQWTYTTGTGCPGNLVLTIDRGDGSFQATNTGASGPIYVISTHVTISYPYQWEFNRVIKLLVSGSAAAQGPSQISVDATVPNMD
jgi:Flp pilus assembly protein TadG